MIDLNTEFHIPSCNNSLVTAIRRKTTYRIRAAANFILRCTKNDCNKMSGPYIIWQKCQIYVPISNDSRISIYGRKCNVLRSSLL